MCWISQRLVSMIVAAVVIMKVEAVVGARGLAASLAASSAKTADGVFKHLGAVGGVHLGILHEDSFRKEPSPKGNLMRQDNAMSTNKPDEAHDASVLGNFVGGALHLADVGHEGQVASEVMGVKKNAEGDTEAFLSALVFNCFSVIFTLCVFVGLRDWFPLVYANRVQKSTSGDTGGAGTPCPHNGFFGWALAAWRLTDDEVVEAAGLDALMFLEFCRLFQRVMCVIFPIVIFVLCPMHYFRGDIVVPPSDRAKDFLVQISMSRLQDAQPALFWVHCALAWLIVPLTLRFANETHDRFLKQRFNWLSHIPEPRSTTLMVESIPHEYRSDKKLKEYFVHLFGEAAIERAYMVRKTGPLCAKVAELEAKEYSLKLAEKKWGAVGNDPAQSPKLRSWISNGEQDAIEVYGKQVQELKAEVSQERARIEDAVDNNVTGVCSGAGFVTFTSRRWCRHASREQYREDTRQLVVGMPPDPSDVIWKDFARSHAKQDRGSTIAVVCIALIFLVWTPLVAMTSSLTSLPSLQTKFPILEVFLEHHPFLNTLLQGVLATFALKFLMGWLPTILMVIIRNFLTLKSGAWAQLKLQNRYFIFLITFVVFITCVGVSLQRTLQDIIDDPKAIVPLLAKSLPAASNFYLSYVLLGWFTVAIELLRWFQLAQYLWFTRISGLDHETARAQSEPEDQDGCGMGARFAKVALIMVLSLLFSTVMPLITFFGFLYFFFCNIAYGYLLVFAETKKPDLGGAFWIAALRHINFALALYVTLMVGILSSQKLGRYPAAATLPLYIVLFLMNRRFGHLNWEILPFESLADICHKKGVSSGCAADLYIQPECRE